MGVVKFATSHIGDIMGVAGGIGLYNQMRDSGHSSIASIGAAAGDFAIWAALGSWAIPLEIARGGHEAGKALHEFGYTNARHMQHEYRTRFGGYIGHANTPAAATMRQRGVQAINQAGLHNYSNLGNEARRYFR